MIAVFIIIAVVVVLAVWALTIYNGLIKLRNRVDESWSGIDVQLKRRHDLVPNLVNTVKGYATHEQNTLQGVIEARNNAKNASGPEETSKAEGELQQALTNINVLAEAYPELKADTSFVNLQNQLSQLEDEIQASRRIYNSNVSTYNTKREVFPNSLIAGAKFPRKDFFELENPEVERAVPNVTF